MSIEIIGGSAAAVIGAGAYLTWAVRPVAIAYRVGRLVGGSRATTSPGRRTA